MSEKKSNAKEVTITIFAVMGKAWYVDLLTPAALQAAVNKIRTKGYQHVASDGRILVWPAHTIKQIEVSFT